MSHSSTVMVKCEGLRLVAMERTMANARKNGRTTVLVGIPDALLVLEGISADQLDGIATDLRTLAQDMRMGENLPCETVDVAAFANGDIVDAVAADWDEITLGECRLADHVLLGDSNVHWTCISGKREQGLVWVRNTKTGERLNLPKGRIVRRVKS